MGEIKEEGGVSRRREDVRYVVCLRCWIGGFVGDVFCGRPMSGESRAVADCGSRIYSKSARLRPPKIKKAVQPRRARLLAPSLDTALGGHTHTHRRHGLTGYVSVESSSGRRQKKERKKKFKVEEAFLLAVVFLQAPRFEKMACPCFVSFFCVFVSPPWASTTMRLTGEGDGQ